MQALELKIKFDTLRISEKGSITGHIWIEVGENSFPEQNWSDMPTAVTSALLGAAVLVRNATSAAKEEVWFLDGPYYISLERSQGSTWLVSLNNMDGFRYWEADVDGSSSFASIRAGAAALVSECIARSWQHPDIQILNDLLNASL